VGPTLHELRLRVPHSGLRYLLSHEGGTTGSRAKDVAIKLARAYERDRWLLSLRRFDRRVDDVRIDRPIFLVGTQGAGETIIGRCLRRHPQVVSVSGNSSHWTGADELGTIRNRMSRLPRTLWGSKHRSDLADTSFGTDQPHACDALLPHYRRTAADANPSDEQQLKRLLREHLAVYAKDPNRARFIDKTHAYTVKMPLLAALLSGTRPFFVLVVRNPYETCCWAVERKPQLFPHGLAREKRMALAAEHWSNSYETAVRDAESVDNVAAVRFEDFLRDPERIVRALCEFVELDFDGDMVPGPGQKLPFATLPGDRKWYPLYPSTWLEKATREDREIVARRCAEPAGRFGYSPRGASPTATAIEVLRPTPSLDAELVGRELVVAATRR
jgi:Sulfotransferase family